MTATDVLDSLRNSAIGVARDGDDIILTAPKGMLTAEMVERVRGRKDELLTLIESISRPTLADTPPDAEGVSYAVWKADQLNAIFRQHGTCKVFRRITAADVRRGLRADAALLQKKNVSTTTEPDKPDNCELKPLETRAFAMSGTASETRQRPTSEQETRHRGEQGRACRGPDVPPIAAPSSAPRRSPDSARGQPQQPPLTAAV